ncbi:MAG TPA: hypothetical protein VHE37_03675, partial [Nevskiaceae bacterium]|nr:hypothetical protein [Nevskiaceae bacterium]
PGKMKIRYALSAVALAASAAAGAGSAIDFKAFMAQVPALPKNSAAAAQAYTAERWDLLPEMPAAVTQLQKDLGAAQVQASMQSAGTPAASPIDPSQAQAMAARLQSMSQQEKIAYAMQMQAQMAPHPAMGVVSDNQGQAIKQISQEQQQLALDNQKTAAMRVAHGQFLAAWDQRDAQLSTQNGRMENGEEGGNADFVCSEAERANRLKAVALHQKIAEDELAQAAKISAEQRAYTEAAIARFQRISALAPQVGPMASMANTALQSSSSDATLAVSELAGFNAEAGRRAARWPHMAAQLPKLRVENCSTGG